MTTPSFTEVATDPKSVGDALRAVISGNAAANGISAASALYSAGGKLLLNDSVQAGVRNVVERSAEKALAVAAGPLLGPATMIAKGPVGLLAQGAKAARSVAPLAARSAGKQLLKGAGKAAGIGFVIDGAVAGVEAISAVRNGKLTTRKAAEYVAKEATTGAIATGAGMLVGAGLVALTGGVAAPVVFAVGALTSIGAKRAMRRFTDRPEAVEVREMPPFDAGTDAGPIPAV